MNAKMITILSGLAAAVLTGCMTCDKAPDPMTTCVGPALAPYVESGELPGAISILQSGDRMDVCCIGWADVKAKRPITLDSPFMQCSQTKGFCGVTVAKLVEEGKISLDDPVSKYLPEFKELWVEDKSPTNGIRQLHRAKNVLTVRMCLNHTGGFPFETSCKRKDVRGGGWSGGARIRQNASVAAASPLLFEPGQRVQYSNTGIDVAAAVVETVTGMRWEEYLQEAVLNPLGMTSTTFWPTDEQIANKIELYTYHKGAPATWLKERPDQQRPYNDDHVFASAGAGLWTTARDQLKFYRMLMNLGLGDNGVRILKEDTVKRLLASNSRGKDIREKDRNYSLGLKSPKVGHGDDVEGWFGHGGAWGTNCMVNWHKKQLRMWVVQSAGKPRPWEKPRDKAIEQFFDGQSGDASDYTGRMN